MTTNDGEDLSRPDQDEPETPESFLAALGKALKEAEGVDAGVADVVVAQILTTTPAKNAITLARDAILKLAEERAAPSIAETSVG